MLNEIEIETPEPGIPLSELPIRSFGVVVSGCQAKGKVYLRLTHNDALCLTNSDNSYTGNVRQIDNVRVRQLAPGETLKITILEPEPSRC